MAEEPCSRERVPYGAIETVFLDVGNTLVSMDFAWIARELAARGVRVEAADVQRAEAAARPLVSARAAREARTEGEDAFRFHVRTVLRQLEAARSLPDADAERLVGELASVLRMPGHSSRLWTWVLAGVREALAELQRAGLQLVAVSNSDGSVERLLQEQGLRAPFAAVHDSGRLGFEKPDPRIFLHALEQAGADPGRTLHVGDLYGVDVAGARAAGIHAVLLDPFGDWGALDCETQPDLRAVARQLLAAR